jgi:rhodanese-related sulfurtransferase
VGAAILEALGFTDVSSLRGGLEAWAQRADPTMPRY